MSAKTWSTYIAPASVTIVVLALWAGSGHDAPAPATLPSRQPAAQHVEIVDRPAAVPASTTEWTEIQEFTQSVWTIAARQGQAQERLRKSVATLAPTMDLNGISNAQIKYLAQLDKELGALRNIKVPKAANADTERFIATAYDSLHTILSVEQAQTTAFVSALQDSSLMLSDEQIAGMNDHVNHKTALFVLSLHRIYWNYGYSDEDINEKSFALKPTAKPKTVVSFNRGES